MNNTRTETIKNIRDMDREMTAWEQRLATIKADIENQKRIKESGEREMAQIRTMAESEAGQKLLKARQETAKVEADRAVLEAQKVEFQEILKNFQIERNDFERDKSDTLAMKKTFEEARARVNQFLTFVKRESEKL